MGRKKNKNSKTIEKSSPVGQKKCKRPFLCKNQSEWVKWFDCHRVPSNGYYGQTYTNGKCVRFIAVLKDNKIGMVWHYTKENSFWYTDYLSEIEDFIREGFIEANPEHKNDVPICKSEQRRRKNKYRGAFSAKAERKHDVKVGTRFN